MFHVKQSGFVFGITGYLALGAVAIILALGIAIKVQGYRLEACRQESAAFIAQTKANGEVAKAAAEAKEKADKLAKEKTDAAYKTLSARHAATSRSLRDARAASRIVPEAPAGSTDPSRACFDRAELERALQRLDAGVSQLVGEGDQIGIRLKLSHEWAKEISVK